MNPHTTRPDRVWGIALWIAVDEMSLKLHLLDIISFSLLPRHWYYTIKVITCQTSSYHFDLTLSKIMVTIGLSGFNDTYRFLHRIECRTCINTAYGFQIILSLLNQNHQHKMFRRNFSFPQEMKIHQFLLGNV